ncbi:MAG: porphobilinogen synthase [Gammaproteobacteria bacterium]
MLNSLRQYPQTRLRRTRLHPWARRLVREHTLTVNDFIWPLFIVKGEQQRQAITTMPGVYRLSIDVLVEEVKQAQALNIPAIALFPMIDQSLKDPQGSEALDPNNLLCNAIKALRAANLDIGIICDVALDPYTDHGHDGVIINNEVDNDATIEILCQQALIQAQAGCDIIAPSDMQDGRIGAIRQALDQHDLSNTMILSYAAKYCSNFYGPFREAVGSQANLSKKTQNPLLGSKASYQQDIANSEEALHEVALDLNEGADLIMVKPGMPYLDIITKIKQTFKVPTFAYQVSGEYSMLQNLSQQDGQDFQKLMLETLISFKRAGADGIFTYAAKEIASFLQTTNGNKIY